MALFDIEYIFLWLRAKAKGERIELKYTCPDCKNGIDLIFNVEDVKIKKVENHTNKIELTESLGVVLNYPNMAIQAKLDKINDEIMKKYPAGDKGKIKLNYIINKIKVIPKLVK